MKNDILKRSKSFHHSGITLILLLSMMNLWMMHQFFYLTGCLEDELFLYSYIVNICTIVIDISIILLICLILTLGKLKVSAFLTFVLTFIWSFVNVFYGRFFFQYLSLSAIGQAEGLTDDVVVKSMLAGFQWCDLYYVFSIIVLSYFIWGKKVCETKLSWKKIASILVIPLLSLLIVFSTYTVYHLVNPSTRGNMLLYKYRIQGLVIDPTESRNAYPNNVVYHAGVLRSLFSEMKELLMPYKLTDEQKTRIEKEYKRHDGRVTAHVLNPNTKNVIFILLESFMSVTSDMIIDGQRITPFMDSLKHANDVYYNGHVHPNITIGESGDGQFIYMTGILPLRTRYTVGEAKHFTMPFALPRLLKSQRDINYSEIIVPSSLRVWQQENMNKVYGFNRCYSKKQVDGNLGEDLTDESVFKLAATTAKTKNQPFYSMVLSISTHQPYRQIVDPYFILNNNSLPQGYLIYLNACHYADEQVKQYINHLKSEKLYDNSLIIIASDHHAHLDAMGMEGKISTDLPLYILHGNIDSSKAYTGPCNQLDVYTTLLDLLNIESDWRGLGFTLLDSTYQNSVSPSVYEISEQIILGNIFNSKQ